MRRDRALARLALAFAEELLPPGADAAQARLEDGQQFDGVAAFVKEIAQGGVIEGRVVGGFAQALAHLDGAVEQRADVDAGHRDGEQSDGRQYRETTAHTGRDGVASVAEGFGHVVQAATGRIGGDDDAAGGVRKAGLQPGAQHPKGQHGLQRGAAFGDDVDVHRSASR